MSLLEWLGESWNPGEVGSVEMGSRQRDRRTRGVVITCFGIAVLLLAGWTWLLVVPLNIRELPAAGWAASLTLFYLFIAYHIHPTPDTSNLGWFGGVMDHPFRYSDDLNRFLLFLAIFLWPGRFIAESLMDMARPAIRVRRRRRLRRTRPVEEGLSLDNCWQPDRNEK